MQTFTKKVLINLLLINNTTQPKAKYSNNVLLAMLENTANDFVAELEPTRNGFAFNRGSLAECLIKSKILNQATCLKSQCLQADLDTSKLDTKTLEKYNLPKSTSIEIKYSTSFAPATHKTSKSRYTLIACESGIYLINSVDLIPTKSGKININNQKAKCLKRLNTLSKELGL